MIKKLRCRVSNVNVDCFYNAHDMFYSDHQTSIYCICIVLFGAFCALS